MPGIDGKNVVKSEDIKEMCAGKVPEGQGHAVEGGRGGHQGAGGTVGFMRMEREHGILPTAIVGKRVVVVGGGFAGLEVAEAMCENREITVIEEAKKMGNGIGIIDKNPTINLVKSKGVKLMPLTKLVEVTKKGAKVQNVETGEEQLIECDTVLTSLG
ncbi:MAG: FAD-dependent oxidoreductase, partial [Eggerthella lenta]